jgi:photosystem II stability/assembly factor-like uncharacterized protein
VPGGILGSTDGGQTWQIATLPAPPPFVSDLVVSPDYVHDGTLLAGTLEDGVFRSGDRGGHWAAWNFGLLDLNILCIATSPDYANDETLFVGTESGVFRSTNGGRAWREVDFSPDLSPVLSLAISPNYTEDGILFAGTESHGLYQSRDRGRSWERLGKDAIPDVVNSILTSPQFPAKPHLLALLADALLVSRDGGRSWSEWKADLATERGLAALLIGLADGEVLRI